MPDRVRGTLPAGEAGDLLAGIETGRVDELGSTGTGPPVVVADTTGSAGDAFAGLAPSRHLARLVVAVSRVDAPAGVSGPDLFLTEVASPPPPWVGVPGGINEALDQLGRVLADHPHAATTLAQVLRLRISIDEGLVVESLAYGALQAGPDHRGWLAGRPARATDNAAGDAVGVERSAERLGITLDRAARRNAYSARMRDELVAALMIAAADPAITSVELRGNGPNFSSGGDLAEFGTVSDPATAHSIRMARNAGWWISRIAPRVTAHVHGSCVGAGTELPAFAGRVVAAPGTTFTLPEVAMGLIPGAGGTVSIPRRIGAPRTAWMALTGTSLDAATALSWGLVDEVAPA